MRSLSLGVTAVVCVAVFMGLAQAAGQDSRPRFASHAVQTPVAADGSTYYIVRLKEAPAATYRGETAGYAATDARARGEVMLDVQAAASYAAYLDERQSALLDSGARVLGHGLQPRYRYHLAFNGMSVRLTPAEAQRIAALPGVLSVRPVRHFAPSTGIGMPASAGDTNASRDWVSAPVVWQLPSNGTDDEGEGVVLADLDTGINHANSSFDAIGPLDGYTAVNPGGKFFGVCDPSNTKQHAFSTPLTCNDKLIGAYSYTHGSDDPDSPEDSEGHGSHTASTVVGDFVSVSVLGASTPLSGVAPHASVIAYDVCAPSPVLCGEDDTMAAVEQAIKDQATLKSRWGTAFKGMVLNFSIGGSNDSPYEDPAEMAFLNAVEAGIYVSAAGGNGGPANAIAPDPADAPQYQVQHLGPWLATLAAATHDGAFSSNKLEGFSGGDSGTKPASNMGGAGDTAGFGPQPLVYTGDASFSGTAPVKTGTAPTSQSAYPASLGAAANAQQCLYPFTPGTFNASEIVVCDRGTNPLVDKAFNVQHGGAAGMVIATTASSSQDMVAEPYVIPTTLLKLSDGNKLRTWINASTGSATPPSAQIGGATLGIDRTSADQVAGFSSRGPNDNAFDAVIKPDMAAPGVSVLAAVSNPLYTDGCHSCSDVPESYDFFDGTSMATPHDSGAGALIKQAHPGWTPAEIKSALMLTSVTGQDSSSPGLTDQCASLDSGNNCIPGTTLPSPQVRGAGRIDVDAAERSGLLLDETGSAYSAADPAHGGDLTKLNLASLGNAACAGTCSWTRTVRSSFTAAMVGYSVSVSRLSGGLKVTVTPSSFQLAPGQTQVLTIQANSAAVTLGTWAFGEMDIKTTGTGDGGAAIPDMHMPMAVLSASSSSSGGGGTPGKGGSSGGGGGGGGELGLFGLTALLLTFLRRKIS
jgi:subtilisin family serine protease